jgi:hypothetical protein
MLMVSNDDLSHQLEDIGHGIARLQAENDRLREQRDQRYKLATATCTVTEHWLKNVGGEPEELMRREVQSWRKQLAEMTSD